jgi:hypothetical protein
MPSVETAHAGGPRTCLDASYVSRDPGPLDKLRDV